MHSTILLLYFQVRAVTARAFGEINKHRNGRYSFMKKLRRLTGFILAMIMALGMVYIPPASASGEKVTVTDGLNTSHDVYVKLETENTINAGSWGGGSPSVDLTQYQVSLHNGTSETISDWSISVKLKHNDGSWNAGWNGAENAGDVITIGTYRGKDEKGKIWDNVNIPSGKDGSGAGFQISAAAMKDADVTITYSKGSSDAEPSKDESSGSSSGSSGSSGPSGGNSGSSTDSSTDKNLKVVYDYAKVLQESLYLYDANMCGDKVDETSALTWRGDCHTGDSDKSVTIDGKTYKVDVSGGFHDAGDHVKFGMPQGYSAAALGLSYYEYSDVFKELGQDSHLKTIADYFCDYFRRCIVRDENGKTVGFVYQVGEGNSDHGYWGAPEKQTTDRPVYTATSSKPGTDAVSIAAAALAINYINFKNADDLKAAEDLFEFAKNNSKGVATEGTGGFYASSHWEDDYVTAAAALYKATDDSSYRDIYSAYDGNTVACNSGWPLAWNDTGAIGAALMGDASKLKGPTDSVKNTGTVDGIYNSLDDWGSCRYNTAAQFTGFIYDKLTKTDTYGTWATNQMNYILGDNPNKRCFFVGYNANSSKWPHHRAASRSGDAAQYNENHYTLLGALVGGPAKNGSYTDRQEEFMANEVTIDYNACVPGAAAALYKLHKNDKTVDLAYSKTQGTISTALDSSEYLTDMKVRSDRQYTTGDAGKDTTESTGAEATTTENQTTTTKDQATTTVSPATTTGTQTTTTSVPATTTEARTTATASPATTTEPPVSVPKLVADNSEHEYTAVYGKTSDEFGSVKVTNEGTAGTDISVSMKSGTSSPFKPSLSKKSVAAAGSITLGLSFSSNGRVSAGTYSDTVILSYGSGRTLEIPVKATVDPAEISISADSVTVTYGDALPDFTCKTNGVFEGDKPDISYSLLKDGKKINTDSSLDSGEYSIVPALDSINYRTGSDSITAGTLTVKKKAVADIAVPVASSIRDNQELADSSLSAADAEKYGTLDWKDKTKGDVTVPAKSSIKKNYDAVLTLSDKAKLNYDFSAVKSGALDEKAGTVTFSVPVTILSTNLPVITFPTAASEITVGDKLPELDTSKASTSWGTFAWENPDTVAEKAGEQSFMVVFTPGENYGSSDSQYQKVTVNVKEKTAAAPASPVLEYRTSDSIRLSAVKGQEYVNEEGRTEIYAGNGVTTLNPLFTGLKPATTYTFWTRVAAVAGVSQASPWSKPLVVTTLSAAPFTVDISKVSDPSYRDLLRTSTLKDGEKSVTGESTPIVSFDAGRPGSPDILTLNRDGHYTLTGKNDNLKIVAAEGVNVSVTFDNCEIKSSEGVILDVTQSTGTVTVSGDAGTDQKEQESVLNGSVTGKNLDISGLNIQGSVTAESLTLGDTAVNGGTISAGTVVIFGNVTVNVTVNSEGSSPAPAVKADKSLTLNDGSNLKITGQGTGAQISVGDKSGGSVTLGGNVKVSYRDTSDKDSTEGTVSAFRSGTKFISPEGSVLTDPSVTVTKDIDDETSGDENTSDQSKTSENPASTVSADATTEAGAGKTTTEARDEKTPATTADTSVTTADTPATTADTPALTDISITGDVKGIRGLPVTGMIKLAKKKTMQLHVSPVPAEASAGTVTFSSSSTSIATVSATGLVKAGKKSGTAVITITSGSVTKTVRIKVTKKPVKKIRLKAAKTVKAGKSVRIRAKVKSSKASQTVYYTSSNPAVATVDQNGRVTGLKKGKVKITARAVDGSGKKAAVKIRVK